MTAFTPVEVGSSKMLIGGEWVHARSGKTFATLNPATEKELAQIPFGDAEDVDAAVHAARRAFESSSYSKISPRERGRLLSKLADLIERDKESLAVLESMDNGKPVAECLGFDLPQAIDTFRYYAGWSDKILGEINPVQQDYFSFNLREPVGVVGQIIPWNFPLLMAAWKLAPAISCGCTVVLKPAEQTPLTALKLGALICEAGFPAGVVNIVTGDGVAGAALAKHPGIDKVAFTGSTEVGKLVMQAAASNLSRVSMELGGKAPNIIFDDADLDAAVQGALVSIFFNQGEVCCAGSRLFVQDKVYDQFLTKFTAAARELKIGNPLDPTTQMGAQVSLEQHEKVSSYIDHGRKAGAKILCGGQSLRSKMGGYFMEPTIFADVESNMKIYKEEIFGPVVAAKRFKTENEAMELAHDTRYGLSAGVWTQNVKRAHDITRKLRAGTVWVNCYNVFDAAVPFGGFKESGFGRELGRAALDLYTETKAVWMKI